MSRAACSPRNVHSLREGVHSVGRKPVNWTPNRSALSGSMAVKDRPNASAPEHVALERRSGASPTVKDTTDV